MSAVLLFIGLSLTLIASEHLVPPVRSRHNTRRLITVAIGSWLFAWSLLSLLIRSSPPLLSALLASLFTAGMLLYLLTPHEPVHRPRNNPQAPPPAPAKDAVQTAPAATPTSEHQKD